jgi:hypothetical protein
VVVISRWGGQFRLLVEKRAMGEKNYMVKVEPSTKSIHVCENILSSSPSSVV